MWNRVSVLSAILASAALATPAGAAERSGLGVYVSNFAGSGPTYTYVAKSGWGAHISSLLQPQLVPAPTATINSAEPNAVQAPALTMINFGGALTREIVQVDDTNLYALLGLGAGYVPASGATIKVSVAPGLGMRFGPLFLEASFPLWSDSESSVLIGGTRQLFGFGAGASFWW